MGSFREETDQMGDGRDVQLSTWNRKNEESGIADFHWQLRDIDLERCESHSVDGSGRGARMALPHALQRGQCVGQVRDL